MTIVGKQTRSTAGAETAYVMHKMLDSCFTPAQASKSFAACIKRYLAQRFPGSSHWSPSKVSDKGDGIVEVNIPGASRAWHDITIVPVLKQKLAIPFAAARGTQPRDWPEAFIVKKKDGTLFLAQASSSGHLTALFALVDRAFQRQDSSLMPSDQQLADAFAKDVAKALDKRG